MTINFRYINVQYCTKCAALYSINHVNGKVNGML